MDETETLRRNMVAEINRDPGCREALEEKHGKVYDTKALTEEFIVHSFAAPFVIATRKSDNVKGSLMFQHYPRFYFDFKEHRE
jgi:hypothetical protein